MKDHIDISTIRRLIDRFMLGETTLLEERQLYAYFKRTDIPAELEAFRPMFNWYDSLMANTDESSDETKTVSSKFTIRSKFIKLLGEINSWQWAGIAAMVALILTVGVISYKSSTTIPEEYLAYKGSYIIRDGKKITDLRIVVPEIIQKRQFVDENLNVIAEKLAASDDAFINACIDNTDLSDPLIRNRFLAALE